jgi:hypothetical protein
VTAEYAILQECRPEAQFGKVAIALLIKRGITHSARSFTGVYTLASLQILPTIDRAPQPAPIPENSMPNNDLGGGAIAGICIGVAGSLLCVAAAILLRQSRHRRQQRQDARAHSAKPATPASPEQATLPVEAGQNVLQDGPSAANARTPSPHLPQAVGYPPHPSEAEASEPLKLPPPPMQVRELQSPSARFGLAASTVATNASADVHSASTTSGARSLSSAMHPAAGSSAKDIVKSCACNNSRGFKCLYLVVMLLPKLQFALHGPLNIHWQCSCGPLNASALNSLHS